MHVVSAQLAGREERAESFVRNLGLHGVPSKFIQHAMTENGGTISGDRVADLDAVVYRLLLRDSSFARLFLLFQRLSAHVLPVRLHRAAIETIGALKHGSEAPLKNCRGSGRVNAFS